MPKEQERDLREVATNVVLTTTSGIVPSGRQERQPRKLQGKGKSWDAVNSIPIKTRGNWNPGFIARQWSDWRPGFKGKGGGFKGNGKGMGQLLGKGMEQSS